MKRTVIMLLLTAWCFLGGAYAQNNADDLLKQAQQNLAQKEYIKSRYLFLQAYNAYASQGAYSKVVECGVKVSSLYHQENYYKEAFDMLRNTEAVVYTGEQKEKKAFPELRFPIIKERLQMYIKLKNPSRAKEQLDRLEETAKAARNDSLSNDLL